jgi:uncharacterized protein DUF6882
MEPQQFSKLRREAMHQLMRLNEECEKEFCISSWPRWDYDLERGRLTFSQEGVPKVLASIHVVGTTSISGGTWLWSWANERLPATVTTAVAKVREFGVAEGVAQLAEAELPDDEHLGWGMTAIAAKLLGAKGAYRCPFDDGFIYVVYSSIKLAADESEIAMGSDQVRCPDHGSGIATYVCEHLVSNPAQAWFSREPDEGNRWPDAWCSACDVFFQEQGEWNEENQSKTKIKILCHQCYERMRSQGSSTEDERQRK